MDPFLARRTAYGKWLKPHAKLLGLRDIGIHANHRNK